jgi:hypothetical protein
MDYDEETQTLINTTSEPSPLSLSQPNSSFTLSEFDLSPSSQPNSSSSSSTAQHNNTPNTHPDNVLYSPLIGMYLPPIPSLLDQNNHTIEQFTHPGVNSFHYAFTAEDTIFIKFGGVMLIGSIDDADFCQKGYKALLSEFETFAVDDSIVGGGSTLFACGKNCITPLYAYYEDLNTNGDRVLNVLDIEIKGTGARALLVLKFHGWSEERKWAETKWFENA